MSEEKKLIEDYFKKHGSADIEELMLNLYAVRDGLIESFETISLNTAVASNLANHINKLGSCIRDIGGRVDDFIPLEHVSGLKTPDINLNAKKVIETTKQCYTLGEITKAKIENDGQTIFIQFEGKEENIVYKARGTVTASLSWKGNEAIDYIYTSGSGRMSVKSFENNRWIDNSNNNDYNIYWELDEINLETEMKKNEKSYENKKELTIEEQNNTNNEKNDVIPIQEI